MKKAARWHLVTTDELAVGGLVDELGIEPIVATLLVQRGVDSAAAARQCPAAPARGPGGLRCAAGAGALLQ